MDAPKTCRAGGGPSAISAVNRQFLPRSWRTGVWEIWRGKEGIWRDRKRRHVRSQPTGHFNRKRRKKDWGIVPTMLPETQHLHAVVQGNAPSHRNGPKMAPGPSLYRKRRRRRGNSGKEIFISTVALESRNLTIRRIVIINGNRRGAVEVRLDGDSRTRDKTPFPISPVRIRPACRRAH